MSRLSSVGTVSIADRIKAFDGSGGGSKSKSSSPAPSLPARATPTPTVPQSPVSRNVQSRSQFSAKDPTRPNNPPLSSSSKSNSRSNILANTSASQKTSSSHNQQTVTKIESYSSSSKKIEKIETEVVTNNGSSSPTKMSSSKSSTTTAIKTSTNGHSSSSVDTPDRAQSKPNIFEIYQERPIPEKRNSVIENNNLNLIKNNNGNVSHNESRSQESLISAGPRSHHDSLTSCSEDLPSFSSSIDDLELRDLRRAKREMDMRLVDREDQVEELANQVEMLLSVKTRLENELSISKKEHKREVADKDDELEDTRASAAKRIKNLEQQLETEHEERLTFVRERHELEGKIMTLKDAIDHGNSEEEVKKLKKDLKRSKALLKDAQLMLEKHNQDGMNKIILRQLKTQLEDAEFARTAALKARGNIELELVETNSMLEDTTRAKTELEDKLVKVSRERADLAQQVKENDEEMMELMKKYKASVSACSIDQITIQDQALTIQQLETERNRAQELLAEMEVKLDHFKGEQVSVAQHRRLELKLREMESKLELEQTSKGRLETQIVRLKEVIEGLNKDNENLRSREKSSNDEVKKLSKYLREAKENVSTMQGKDTEYTQKKLDFEKQLELAEAETISVRNELKLAQRRIEDLQVAIQGDMDTSVGESDEDDETDTADAEVWLAEARRRIVRRESQHNSLTDTSLSVNSNDREIENIETF